MATTDKNIGPVVDALLSFAEDRAGTPFEVRFRKRNIAPLAQADNLFTKGLLEDDGTPAPGGDAVVGQLFAGDDGKQRDAAIVKGLERAFKGVFPADVFPLKAAAPIDDATAAAMPPLPKPPFADVNAPTFVVDVDVSWSGATLLARDLKRRYLGLQVRVDVIVQIPHDPRLLTFALKAVPPDALPVDWSSAPKDAKDDAFIYDALIISAFEDQGAKLSSILLSPAANASRL